MVVVGSMPQPDLVEMPQQISRVLVDAIGAGLLQFFPAVAAREQADRERDTPVVRPGGPRHCRRR